MIIKNAKMLDNLTSLVTSRLHDIGCIVDSHKNNRFGRKTNMYRYTVKSPKGRMYNLFFSDIHISVGYDYFDTYENFDIDELISIFENCNGI